MNGQHIETYDVGTSEAGGYTIGKPALLFLLGVLLSIPVQLVGTLYLGELALLAAALWGCIQRATGRVHWPRYVTRSVMLIVVMVFAYLVSDSITDNDSDNAVRGIARSIFLFADLLGMHVVLGRRLDRLPVLCSGYAVAQIISTSMKFSDADITYVWKFGFAWPATMAVMMITPRLTRNSATACAFVGASMGYVHMWLDYRSLSTVCLAVAAILVFRRGSDLLRKEGKPVAAVLACVLVAALVAYAYVATEAEFGQRRSTANAARMAGIMTALERIVESPLLGRGSWAYDNHFGSQYSDVYFELTGQRIRQPGGDRQEFGAHSQLLMSWYEGGLLAVLYFVYLAAGLIRTSWYTAWKRPFDRHSPLVLQLLLFSLWHVFLSPFAGEHRLWIGVSATVVGILLTERTEDAAWLSYPRPSGFYGSPGNVSEVSS